MPHGPYGVYEVTGWRKYRGHETGTIFEASLDPAVEQRAIARGAIRLLERVTPSVVPAHFKPPAKWPPQGPQIEAPEGASRV